MSTCQAVTIHRGQRANLSASELAAAHGLTIVAFVDHNDGASFETWRERFRDLPSIVTALDPATRRALVDRIATAGGSFLTLGKSGGGVSSSVTFGDGSLVLGDGALSINFATTVGRHVILMTPASIGHDCTIGDFVTIFPSAAISGNVDIADDVVIDAGCVIVNGSADRPLRVGRGARIDVGAVVTKSVPSGATIAGNPGRIVHR